MKALLTNNTLTTLMLVNAYVKNYSIYNRFPESSTRVF